MIQRKRVLPKLPGREARQSAQPPVQVGDVCVINLDEIRSQLAIGDRSFFFRWNGRLVKVHSFDATGRRVQVKALDEANQETDESVPVLSPDVLSVRV